MFRDVTTLFADARGFACDRPDALPPYAAAAYRQGRGPRSRASSWGALSPTNSAYGFVPNPLKRPKLPARRYPRITKLRIRRRPRWKSNDDAVQPGGKSPRRRDLLHGWHRREAGNQIARASGAEIVSTSFIHRTCPALGRAAGALRRSGSM